MTERTTADRPKTARQDPNRTWNSILQSDACGFKDEHPDASVFIFSAWNLFTDVLDDPITFGFQREDAEKAGGGIWFDRLHPTTKMHRLIAERIAEFLQGVGEESEREDGNNNEDLDIVFD